MPLLSVVVSTSKEFPCCHSGTSSDSLGEVGQVLGDLGDERECARRAVVRVLLHEVEERWRHDGRAQEAQEERGADQTLADVRPAAAAALLSPRREHLFQLPWKDAAERRRRDGRNRVCIQEF